ncbi:MAG TPA: AAA family ATPase [Anaerolineales bacterium]
MSRLQLFLLGPPEVRVGAKPLTFPTRKSLALLIYLALEPGPQPREHLAALLWPESSPDRSRASLRSTLNRLQSSLGQAGSQAQTSLLSIDQNALTLRPNGSLDLDLRSVESAYAQARAERVRRAPPQGSTSLPVLQQAVAFYRGDFLAGFSLGDAPGFDDWTDLQREVWRRRLGLILDRLSEIQFGRGEFAGVAETASLWIALDPLNEAAYRRKMRAHFAAGERGQALEAYETCRAKLASELNVEPDPDTQALAGHIRTRHPIPQAAARPGRPDSPLAVLGNLFAGRDAEQRALVERFQRAGEGYPQLVILRGEAGVGRTRLAAEFLAWASAEGAEVLQGSGFESGSLTPFQPLVEAIRSVFERGNTPGGLLGETWLSPLATLLPELQNRIPDLPSALRQEEAGPRTQLLEAVVRLTLALAERAPLVLFVDDLQWADRATLDLLQYAARRWRESAARIMLMVSLRSEGLRPFAHSRGESLSEWLAQVEQILEPLQLDLQPLGERDTVGMVQSILALPNADFAQWVFEETRGQPFYLKQTLKDLIERRALLPKRRADGKWAFEVDAEHDLGKAARVPSTVWAVIRARLNRLSPNGFALLAAGAVLEQGLTFERLCAISHLEEDEGLAALDELISSRLLVEGAQPDAPSAYAFAHNMIREVVYTEAGDARRRLFHRRALDVLEAGKVPAAALAHHALAAGEEAAAFRRSLIAGQEALRLDATSEAIVHFERARQIAKDSSLRGAESEAQIRELYLHLSQAYKQSGQHDQARAVEEELAGLKSEQS